MTTIRDSSAETEEFTQASIGKPYDATLAFMADMTKISMPYGTTNKGVQVCRISPSLFPSPPLPTGKRLKTKTWSNHIPSFMLGLI